MIGDFGPGTLVPIVFIFMIVAVVIGPIWISAYFRARERAQLHETLRVAYEKGVSPPPELIEKLTNDATQYAQPQSQSTDRDLRRAVVLIAVGIGLGLLGCFLGAGIGMQAGGGAGWIVGGSIAGGGAIPGMIGVGYLLLWMTGRSNRKL